MPVTHTILPEAAIDVGFSSTKFTYGTGTDRSGTVILADLFPSHAVLTSESSGPSKSEQLGGATPDGVIVEVEGAQYFVGKSVLQASSGVGNMRLAFVGYSETPQYRAMFLGALYYIAKHKQASVTMTIERLCLGLPVGAFFGYREHLQKMAEGIHEIPSPMDPSKTIKVNVKNAIVVSQPQGAAMNYGLKLGKNMEQDRVVVLDLGGGTFDWFFLDRLMPNFKRSGDAKMGVLSCIRAVCDKLNPAYANAPLVGERINDALVKDEKTLRVDGYEYEMSTLWPAALHVLDSGLVEMAKSVGNFSEVDSFLFAGGGAKLLQRAALQNKSPIAGEQRKFVIDKDPVFSNVLGFHQLAQLAGEET